MMNVKIIICVIFSLIISFGLFLIVENQFPGERILKQRDFYSQGISSDNKVVLLMGSSHVGQLNSTLIHEDVSQKFPQHIVYNLSYGGDKPNKRIQNINEIIELNPKIILYGISYRDFQIKLTESQLLPDPQQYFKDFFRIDVGLNNEINPKFTSLEIIRDFFSNTGLFPTREVLTINNSPFYNFNSHHRIILNDTEIKKQTLDDVQQIKNSDVEFIIDKNQIVNFKSIIEKLQKNKINIIIFSTPLHPHAIEQIPLETKTNFLNIIKDIETNYNVKVYDLSDKYFDKNIWANIDHISYNKKSKIYSDDITNIIITELEK